MQKPNISLVISLWYQEVQCNAKLQSDLSAKDAFPIVLNESQVTLNRASLSLFIF